VLPTHGMRAPTELSCPQLLSDNLISWVELSSLPCPSVRLRLFAF